MIVAVLACSTATTAAWAGVEYTLTGGGGEYSGVDLQIRHTRIYLSPIYGQCSDRLQ